jgi:hypothetical protein
MTKLRFRKDTKGHISLLNWDIEEFDGIEHAIKLAVTELLQTACDGEASCWFDTENDDPLLIEICLPFGDDAGAEPSWYLSLGDKLSEHIKFIFMSDADWKAGGKESLASLKLRLLGLVKEIDDVFDAKSALE